MGKVGRSIELVKASWAVLRQDKELLALPAISGVCALLVIASFSIPVAALTISANAATTAGEINYPPVAIAIAFLGEGLAGHIGLGVINVAIFIGLFAFVGISALVSPVLLYGTVPLALLALLVAVVVMSALATVFQTALYRHAVELPVDNFDAQLMNDAFSHKKNWTAPPPSDTSYSTS